MEPNEFMLLLNNSIGTKVDIINKSGLHKGNYTSSLIDVKNGLIGLAQPMYRGTWMFMSGVELIIRIKSGDTLLEAAIFSRETSSKDYSVPILWVVLSGEITKIQRRSFLRVPCYVETRCFDLGAGVPELKNWFDVLLKNVSLGGAAASVRDGSDTSRYIRGERYLLAANLGSGVMFFDSLLRNIIVGEDGLPTGAFSFEGLSVCQERIMMGFVRKQELAAKS